MNADETAREILAIVLARVEAGETVELPVEHREAVAKILDAEYAHAVRIIDRNDATFAIRRVCWACEPRIEQKSRYIRAKTVSRFYNCLFFVQSRYL